MGFQGRSGFSHAGQDITGVLLVNLGTPEHPNPGALRRYLAEFLRDPRVVEVPRPIWLPLLYGVILPFRAPRSAHAYQQVWTDQGSPLRVYSEGLTAAAGEALNAAGARAEVALAMRYGRPGIADVLRNWKDRGLRRLLVLPLYPQYSATTTASVFDAVMQELTTWRWLPELRWVNDYWSDSGWIEAIAQSIAAHWQSHARSGHLVFSFHGIPQRYLRNGDPYFCQCHASARMIAKQLDLSADEWSLSFQSRVGKEPWLQPYTDQHLRSLATSGTRTVDVVCPGFAVDCLETLEEIAMQNAEGFRAAGGDALRYIPALNDSPAHAQLLANLVLRHGQGWAGLDPRIATDDPAERQRRFAAYEGPQA